MITPLGKNVESSWQALIEGRHGIQNIRDTILSGYSQEVIKTSLAAPVENFNLFHEPRFDIPEIKKAQKKWHRSAQFVLWAGLEALQQAELLNDSDLRLKNESTPPERFGISMGTGIGGASIVEEARLSIDSLSSKRIHPSDLLQVLPGRVDEVASMVFGARAFTDTTLAECAAGISSIARGADDLKLGRADIVLAGGVEAAINPSTIALFEATKAVSEEINPETAPRPFDEKSSGIVFGEGAGMVVLETLEHARRRGAMVLAEVLGYGKSSDAFRDTYPSDSGGARAMSQALSDAQTEVNNAYINAHATGTSADHKELNAISEVFSPEQVAGISSTKGATGHMFGAAGAVETIFSVLALRDNLIPPTLKLENPIPEAKGWYLSAREVTELIKDLDVAINNSFGFGGKNHVMVFGSLENA